MTIVRDGVEIELTDIVPSLDGSAAGKRCGRN